jgi:hypothetical protein
MEKIIKKYKSFEEAERAEVEYWCNASFEDRINALLSIQEMMLELFYPEIKSIEKIMTRKSLRDEE